MHHPLTEGLKLIDKINTSLNDLTTNKILDNEAVTYAMDCIGYEANLLKEPASSTSSAPYSLFVTKKPNRKETINNLITCLKGTYFNREKQKYVISDLVTLVSDYKDDALKRTHSLLDKKRFTEKIEICNNFLALVAELEKLSTAAQSSNSPPSP